VWPGVGTDVVPVYQLTSHAEAAEERNYRVLRGVYNPSVHPLRVITVYFDRRLRGRP